MNRRSRRLLAVAPPSTERNALPAAAPRRVRIIGGRWRRTPLPVADRPGLRPTPDRVRETLFNWLAHLRPDAAALRGLDLFAGTGALGLELASRGARAVTLVERDPALVARLRELKAKLEADAVEIVAGDALAVARGLPPASFDVVFVDPPFDAGLHAAAIAAALPLLAPGALLYVESPVRLTGSVLEAHGLAEIRHLQAGRVHAQLIGRAGGTAQPGLPGPADG